MYAFKAKARQLATSLKRLNTEPLYANTFISDLHDCIIAEKPYALHPGCPNCGPPPLLETSMDQMESEDLFFTKRSEDLFF